MVRKMRSIAQPQTYADVSIRVTNEGTCPFILPTSKATPDLHLSLRSGATLLLDGATGAGKSTLAKHLLRRLQAHACSNNTPVLPKPRPASKNAMGFTVTCEAKKSFTARMLFQNASLLDELSVLGNLKLAQEQQQQQSRSEGVALEDMLELVGLPRGVGDMMPFQLSVGMRRRAALAQALVGAPDVLVLDEPFAALDDKTATFIAKTLVKLQHVSGTCVVLITHRKEFVKPFNVTQEVILEAREREIEAASSFGMGRSRLASRVVIEFYHSVLCALPLVIIAGVFVGAGTAIVIGKIVQAVQMPALLAVLPKTVKENPLYAMVKGAVSEVAGAKLPSIKRKVTATAMSYVFAVEVAPLLVALATAGRFCTRLGGSIATMQATEQEQLLSSLGVSSVLWTGIPAFVSMCIGGPLLVFVNYFTLVFAGVEGLAMVVPDEQARAQFREKVRSDSSQAFWEHNFNGCQGTSCGLAGYPPFILFYRSLGFMLAVFTSIVLTLHIFQRSNSPSQIATRLSSASNISVLSILALEFVYGVVLYSSLNVDLAKILKR